MGSYHVQPHLPRRRDDVRPIVLISELLLEGGQCEKGGYYLRIKPSHDNRDAEQKCPSHGMRPLLDSSPKWEFMLLDCNATRFVNGEDIAFMQITVISWSWSNVPDSNGFGIWIFHLDACGL
jgi:hypothetical protein